MQIDFHPFSSDKFGSELIEISIQSIINDMRKNRGRKELIRVDLVDLNKPDNCIINVKLIGE